MSQSLSLTGLLLRAMRLACLLLSCAVALSRAGVIVENGFPILWGHTAGAVTDFSVSDEGAYILEPWHYQHRMSFYRLIIANTDTFMTSMGSEPNQSPIWGLPLQLGWMLTSGRLADPTGTTTCGTQGGDGSHDVCISPNSWWACVNYFNSVLPFLSAVQNGILGEGVRVVLATAPGAEGYCTTYETCLAAYPDAMHNWDNFYKGMIAAFQSPMPENEKKDWLLGLYWNATTASTHASSVCNSKLSSYSVVETSFAHSWLNSGEYVAAVYFQSSLDLAPKFMAPLPGRVLKAEDSPPNIADLSAEENHLLYIYSWMNSIEGLLGNSLVNVWRNSMCSVQKRQDGREKLEQLMLNPEYATSSFVTLVTSMSTGCN